MARTFTSAGTKSLIGTTTPVTAAPLTLAAWGKPANTTANHIVLAVMDNGSDPDSDSFFISFSGAVGGDPVEAFTASAGSFGGADTTAGFSASTWQHACGVFAAANDRRAYLNGGNKGTNSTSLTPSGITRAAIGAWGTSGGLFYVDGDIAEAAVWNAALTDDEVAELAAGYCPLFVRPKSLVAYWPLTGRGGAASNAEDWVGTHLLTQSNSPAVADHPRIIYPSRRRLILPQAAAGGVSLSPAAADLALSTVAPSRVTDVRRDPASGDLALSTVAPSRVTDVRRDPASGDLVLSPTAPTAARTDNHGVTPSAGDLALSTVAPTAARTDNHNVSPAAADLVLSPVAPSVQAGGSVSISPNFVDLSLSTTAPTVARTDHRTLSPSAADLALSAVAPGVSSGANVSFSPDAANLVLSTVAPTIARSANIFVTPSAGDLALSAVAPTVGRGDRVIIPAAANLLLSSVVPLVVSSVTSHRVATNVRLRRPDRVRRTNQAPTGRG